MARRLLKCLGINAPAVVIAAEKLVEAVVFPAETQTPFQAARKLLEKGETETAQIPVQEKLCENVENSGSNQDS